MSVTKRKPAPIDRRADCVAAAPQPGAAPFPDMVWVPGGTFIMGSAVHYPEEGPPHVVTVDGFWIDRQPVTNAAFARFVAATGRVTLAERPPDPALYPGAKPEMLVPASIVFRKPDRAVDLGNPYEWWANVPGANWRRPEGPETSIAGREHHPVVQVGYADVEAYARWAGKALPTEAEWEFAARGGLDGKAYAWGDELTSGGRFMANTWQGDFPLVDLASDGFAGTSPVGAFPANGYGLFDMIGNVWEWTTDWYEDRHTAPEDCCGSSNPRGGRREKSIDPRMPGPGIPRKVMKGGSYLCAPNYCRRYRPAARMGQPIDTATCHLGFRCIVRPRRGER